MAGQPSPANNKAFAARNRNADGKIRLFVAIELPQFLREALAQLQAEIRKTGFPAKFTAAENIHMTIKFLGDTPASLVEDIGGKLADAVDGFPPITLWAAGLSVFPSVKRPRVLWTGTGGETDRLARLQKQVEENLSAIGFAKEERPFTAHLTLARFKGSIEPETIISTMARYGNFASGSFSAAEICLFESRLTPKGPVYNRLQVHRLAGSPE